MATARKHSPPLVSVVIATFNSGNFLIDSVGSILKQSLNDFELIVVDDGSTDNTDQIIRNFNDYRIKFFRLPENNGIAQARNFGNAMATGKYLAVMDADDQAHPRRLEYQAKYLDRWPHIGIVGSQVIKAINKRHILMKYADDDAIIKARLLALNGSALIHPSTMIRRNLIRDLFINYPGSKTDIDHHMWFLAARRGINFGVVEKPLLIYRRHGSNITSENSDDAQSHQRRKKTLRVDILSCYFPNESQNLLNRVADVFGPDRIRTSDLYARKQLLDFLHRLPEQGSVFGESRAELNRLIYAAL